MVSNNSRVNKKKKKAARAHHARSIGTFPLNAQQFSSGSQCSSSDPARHNPTPHGRSPSLEDVDEDFGSLGDSDPFKDDDVDSDYNSIPSNFNDNHTGDNNSYKIIFSSTGRITRLGCCDSLMVMDRMLRTPGLFDEFVDQRDQIQHLIKTVSTMLLLWQNTQVTYFMNERDHLKVQILEGQSGRLQDQLIQLLSPITNPVGEEHFLVLEYKPLLDLSLALSKPGTFRKVMAAAEREYQIKVEALQTMKKLVATIKSKHDIYEDMPAIWKP
ncbi:hypothetical protein BGZ83_007858 [Gryganskiella cystojenkinii]|nr:hypothetical protein BGZ83_007858 [Gryganskiella cystojenkinii]